LELYHIFTAEVSVLQVPIDAYHQVSLHLPYDQSISSSYTLLLRIRNSLNDGYLQANFLSVTALVAGTGLEPVTLGV
jgi:hypothetical protein